MFVALNHPPVQYTSWDHAEPLYPWASGLGAYLRVQLGAFDRGEAVVRYRLPPPEECEALQVVHAEQVGKAAHEQPHPPVLWRSQRQPRRPARAQ
eukprot:2403322-Prymnesium_polylepis.2